MRHITRRRFLQYGLGAGAALALPWAAESPSPRGEARQADEVRRAAPAPGSGDRRGHAERTEQVLVHPDRRSAGSCIPTCRRRRCGRTTTAPGSEVRPARSGWRSWRRAAPRSR